jgi:hypothetical protein
MVLTAIVVFIILFLVISFMSGPSLSDSPSDNAITASTTAREALPPGSVTETNYFTDELGWIRSESQLTEGMRRFYWETGVQPYLYITDSVNGSNSPSVDELDAFAHALYDKLFDDEAHLLLVFFEYNGQYMSRYVAGTQAKTVIDTDAADILLDYIDRYYYDQSLSEEQMFSKAFADSAKRMMEVTTSPWVPAAILFGLALLAGILFFWWRHAKQQKNTFGDLEAEQLAKKYDENKNEEN